MAGWSNGVSGLDQGVVDFRGLRLTWTCIIVPRVLYD